MNSTPAVSLAALITLPILKLLTLILIILGIGPSIGGGIDLRSAVLVVMPTFLALLIVFRLRAFIDFGRGVAALYLREPAFDQRIKALALGGMLFSLSFGAIGSFRSEGTFCPNSELLEVFAK